jgi:drug/metabolite transporter (DMT)-like permease
VPAANGATIGLHGFGEDRMKDVAAVAALGIARTAGGFAAFFALIRIAGPVRASITAYFSPIVAVLAGNVVLDEPITSQTVPGISLILVGAYCANRDNATKAG